MSKEHDTSHIYEPEAENPLTIEQRIAALGDDYEPSETPLNTNQIAVMAGATYEDVRYFLQTLEVEPINPDDRIKLYPTYVFPIVKDEFDKRLKIKSVQETETPVTIEQRILALGQDYEPTDEPLNQQQIAFILGVDHAIVKRIIRNIGIKPIDPNAEQLLYPEYTLSLVGEELAWKREYDKLDPFLRVPAIAEFSARSKGWTRKFCEAQTVRRKRDPENSNWTLYPRTICKTIREINLRTPTEGDMVTLSALVNATGFDRDWIERKLNNWGIQGEDRRATLTGRVFTHYPPNIIPRLTDSHDSRPAAGGDWVTVERMVNELGEDDKWVKRRAEAHKNSAELRQDDHGVSRTHYPPSVMASLRAESETKAKYPQAEEFMVVTGIAKQIGKSQGWTKKKIEQLIDDHEIAPEIRIDGRGKPAPHFSPRVVERLIELSRQELGI